MTVANSLNTNQPIPAVGVVVIKDGKVLMGKRKGDREPGKWSFPGGHIEFKEDPQDAAIRETYEEAGIKIANIRQGPFVNLVYGPENQDRHYVLLYFVAEYQSGEVKVMEPDRFESWDWFDWNDLPSPIIFTIEKLIETGFNPFDEKWM